MFDRKWVFLTSHYKKHFIPGLWANNKLLLCFQWMQPSEEEWPGTCLCLRSGAFPSPTNSASQHLKWKKTKQKTVSVHKARNSRKWCNILSTFHLHVSSSNCMMQGGFSLIVSEAQVSSILHHFMHNVDVSLPDDNATNGKKATTAKNKNKKTTIMTLWLKKFKHFSAHLQAKWKAVCPASLMTFGSAPLLRNNSTRARLPWMAA